MIKIRVSHAFDGEFTLIKIDHQDFRGEEFNKSGTNGRSFISSDGFVLTSCECPEIAEGAFYVRGDCVESDDEILVIPNMEWYVRAAKAIDEYNTALTQPEKKEAIVPRLPRYN